MNTIQKVKPKYTIVSGNVVSIDAVNIEAIKALISADVIIYDELTNPELFKFISNNIPRYLKRIFNSSQGRKELINQFILELSFRYGHVVHIQGIDLLYTDKSAPALNFIEAFNIEANHVSLITASYEIFLN